jgi:hypothetical protein
LDEGGVAKLAQPDHPGGDHGIEDFAHREMKIAPEQAEIEVHSLEDDFFFRQNVAEGLEIDRGQGIDQQVFLIESELDEAKLFKVAMEAVRLGIDRDPAIMTEAREKLGQF